MKRIAKVLKLWLVVYRRSHYEHTMRTPPVSQMKPAMLPIPL